MLQYIILLGCSHNSNTQSAEQLPTDNIVFEQPEEQSQKKTNEIPQEIASQEPEPEPTPDPPKIQSPDGVIMSNCPEDIPEDMACIPGGKMIRGYSGEHVCTQGENINHKTKFGPTTEVWIQTFFMDKTEVTYEAYQKCVKEKKCDYAHPSYGDFNRPKQAMMGANWYAAKKFCEAHGKRLPTEAEWEKAARGDSGAQNPFDLDEVSCEQAVIKDETGRSCGVKKLGGQPEKGRVWEVGLKPAGRYGLYDMVGNAEEWVEDWFAPSLEACGKDCLGTNPKGPCYGEKNCPKFALQNGTALKMVKGGSWYWPAEDATAWHRRPHFPKNKPYHHFGFRCARDIERPSTEPSNETP